MRPAASPLHTKDTSSLAVLLHTLCYTAALPRHSAYTGLLCYCWLIRLPLMQGGPGRRNRAAHYAVSGEAHWHACWHVCDCCMRCAKAPPCEQSSITSLEPYLACKFAFWQGRFLIVPLRSCAARCAGIFVNDILDAVPIDKYFELFKPGAGGEGGYIRISINFVNDLKDLEKPAGALSLHASALLATSPSSR